MLCCDTPGMHARMPIAALSAVHKGGTPLCTATFMCSYCGMFCVPHGTQATQQLHLPYHSLSQQQSTMCVGRHQCNRFCYFAAICIGWHNQPTNHPVAGMGAQQAVSASAGHPEGFGWLGRSIQHRGRQASGWGGPADRIGTYRGCRCLQRDCQTALQVCCL